MVSDIQNAIQVWISDGWPVRGSDGWTATRIPLADALALPVGGEFHPVANIWPLLSALGLPQYNCEFALYCRKGSPTFVDLRAFPTCFNAGRREHSRNPDEFYDMVRRVTGGLRLDVFSR